jgi:hypothetical protein
LLPRLTAEEQAVHLAFLATLGEHAIWQQYRREEMRAGSSAATAGA